MKYCRLNIENDQELALFEKALKIFSFNYALEDDGEPEKKRLKNGSGNSAPASSSSKKTEVNEVLELFDDDDDDDLAAELAAESQDFL